MGFLDRLMGKPLEKPAFAEAMAKGFAKQGVGVNSVDLQAFELVLDTKLRVNLGNVYGQYVAAGAADRDRIVEKFVSAALQKESIPARYEDARKGLMPVLRGAAGSSLLELQMRLNGVIDAAELGEVRWAERAIAEGLVVGLAFDSPKSFTHINERQMKQWGVGFDAALSDAMENLRGRTNESEIRQEAPGMFAGRWGDSYESSRVLLTDLVYRMGAGSDPVVFVPARDEFWVAGRGDLRAINLLLRANEEKHFGPYGLFPAPLVPVDGEWKLFEGEDDESRMLIRNLRLKRAGSDYAQQKQYLDAINQRDCVDIFVAKCMMTEDKATGAVATVSTWTKGIESSLPETVKVFLIVDTTTKEHVIATWDVVRRVVGEMLEEEPGLVPKRWRTRGFPSAEQVEELRRNA